MRCYKFMNHVKLIMFSVMLCYVQYGMGQINTNFEFQITLPNQYTVCTMLHIKESFSFTDRMKTTPQL